MRAWVFALAAGGCGFQARSSGSAAGNGTDEGAMADAAIDGAELNGKLPPTCLGTFLQVCVDPPASPVTLTAPIDTGTSKLCVPYTATPAIDACVISGQSIAIAGGTTVAVTGRKPLILLATDGITISGTLDAASHPGQPGGPGADAGPCPAIGFTNPTHGGQGGGGWGGSFGTAGARGGGGATGNGGIPPAAFATTTLRGGCPGADGADNGRGKGARGRGGGAVVLLAAHTLTIDGTVTASGAGGGGATSGGGGGGGGSGGMIVLDAATVNTPGKVFANGGGGGEGGSLATGHGGGESSAPGSAGGGGNGGSQTGGDGGDGSSGTTQPLPGGSGGPAVLDSGGGGAGGGGAGIIKVIAPEQNNTHDPAKLAPLPS
jgi:hypothetical protein